MTVSAASSSSAGTPSGTASLATTNPSGLDWNALIQAQVNAKLATATTVETKITNNEAKVSAYQNLQSLLSSLASAANPLASSNTSSLSTSIFSARSADITANGNVSATSVVSMTLNNGAPIGAYTLEVGSLAEAQKVAGASVASESTALGYTGSLSLGLAGGASATVSISADMTLQDVVAVINAQMDTTDVQASIVQVSASQYEMVLTGTQDGANIVTSSTSGDDVLAGLGVTDGSGNFKDEIQKAQMANITLDGINITRNTNDISDVLDGVTFHLLQPTPAGTSLNINVGTDADQITTALQTLVTDYNAYRDFVTSQQKINSDGTASSDTVLFGDSTMNDIMTQLQGAMNTTVNGLSLSDLGLSFSSTNDLQLDTGVLHTTLSTNLKGVEALLATQATTSSADLSTIAAGGAAPGSFTLDVAVDGSGNLVSASVGGDSSMFTVSGDTILGNPGTPYAGMAFAYSGTTSQSIVVTTTPGIASMLNSIAETNSDPLNGTLQDLVSNLQTQDGTFQQQVSDIQSQASTYQAELQSRYAQYQAAIQEATTTLDFLQSLLNSESKS
jgi:flagellar hook-associated protein 2